MLYEIKSWNIIFVVFRNNYEKCVKYQKEKSSNAVIPVRSKVAMWRWHIYTRVVISKILLPDGSCSERHSRDSTSQVSSFALPTLKENGHTYSIYRWRSTSVGNVPSLSSEIYDELILRATGQGYKVFNNCCFTVWLNYVICIFLAKALLNK